MAITVVYLGSDFVFEHLHLIHNASQLYCLNSRTNFFLYACVDISRNIKMKQNTQCMWVHELPAEQKDSSPCKVLSLRRWQWRHQASDKFHRDSELRTFCVPTAPASVPPAWPGLRPQCEYFCIPAWGEVLLYLQVILPGVIYLSSFFPNLENRRINLFISL